MPTIAIRKKRKSLKQNLFRGVLLLVALLLVVLAAGLLLFGRFSTPRAELADTLRLQMTVYRNEMESYWKQLTVMGLDLSEDLTELVEEYLAENDRSFASLRGDADAAVELQSALLDPIREHLIQTGCSGAFAMLESSVYLDREDSRTGLYIIKSLSGAGASPDAELLLFRGSYGVGRQRGIMEHRKWSNEFRTELFPDYEKLISSAAAPIHQSYRLTSMITLPGTDEKVILLTVPILGADGTLYGLCGFQVSQRYFKEALAQPSNLSRMICMLAPDGDTLDAGVSLSCGITSGYFLAPVGELTADGGDGVLVDLSGRHRYVGITERIPLSCGDPDYRLAVMVPREDYTGAMLRSGVQVLLLALFLLFFAVVSCRYFTRRFLRPVLDGLEALKQEDRSAVRTDVVEIDTLASHLSAQDEAHNERVSALEQKHEAALAEKETLQSQMEETQSRLEVAQADASRLARSQKSDIDPEQYQMFLAGLPRLTEAERRIYNGYIDGMSTRELLDRFGVKESTLKTQKQSIFNKLGIRKVSELQRYAAILRQTQEEQGGDT